MANTAWNPSDKTANCTLSGGNLIATSAAAGTNVVRAVDKQVTGKFYWECTCNTITGTTTGVAIYSPTYSLAGVTFGSAGATGTCGLNRLGTVYVDGTSALAGFGAIANGTVVCVAVDCAAQLIWFRLGAAGLWNLSAGANPATGSGGVKMTLGAGIPLLPTVTFTASADQIIANFGDSAFTGAVPAGFTSGFTAGASIPTNALATQAALEQFIVTNPDAQITQVAVEQWASTGTISGQAMVTQVALEQWALLDLPAPPSSGVQARVMVMA